MQCLQRVQTTLCCGSPVLISYQVYIAMHVSSSGHSSSTQETTAGYVALVHFMLQEKEESNSAKKHSECCLWLQQQFSLPLSNVSLTLSLSKIQNIKAHTEKQTGTHIHTHTHTHMHTTHTHTHTHTCSLNKVQCAFSVSYAQQSQWYSHDSHTHVTEETPSFFTENVTLQCHSTLSKVICSVGTLSVVIGTMLKLYQ